MRRLLLISSSRVHGRDYLDHAAAEISDLLDGAREILFVPFAQADHDGYETAARAGFEPLGVELRSIHHAADPATAVAAAPALFIGGGNTFLLLRDLVARGLITPIRERALAGMPYIGTSAGSNVACASVRTTNDMPIVYPPTFDALALVPFNLNPHYLDPDPSSTHMGETRETRIREFHEHNEPPVVGLREPAMLRIDGDRLELKGQAGARVFRRGQPAEELAPGRYDDLLDPARWVTGG